MKKLYFPKRIPEPKEMGKMEMRAFEQLSKNSYKTWLMPLVDHALHISALKKGAILDVACGPGLLIKELATRSQNFEVTGIDISIHAINMAKKNCKSLGNVKFKVASASDLPFPNEYFDLVICKDSLHHFDQLYPSLNELSRVTKKGSYIYLQDLRRDLPGYLLKRSTPPDTVIKKLQFFSTRAAYTKKELDRVIKHMHCTTTKIFTRKLNKKLTASCKKANINTGRLRESFQSRYVALLKK